MDLDELTPIEIEELCFQGLKNLSPIKTEVLITLPQTLLSRTVFPMLNHIIKSNMIWFVVYDKIHLAAHFVGSSFRDKFAKLKNGFFLKFPPSMPTLVMPATYTPTIRESFETLIGTHINHTHWPALIDMVNRKQAIYFRYTNHPKSHVKTLLQKDHIKGDPLLPNKAIIYPNG